MNASVKFNNAVPDSTTAVFNSATGTLTITGNDLDNTIVVRRDAVGILRINNGAVSVTGGTPTVVNTTLIQMFGRRGSDQISLDETNGATSNSPARWAGALAMRRQT